MLDELWHQKLGQPYLLAKRIDSGKGQPIVLLHGLGRSAPVWQPLIDVIDLTEFQVVAFDLLGSGDSPKPAWADYDIDIHAQSVITSIERQFFGQKIIIVGHSLGALVALRVGRLRPDLVKHLLLYEMPLYDGLPEKAIYKARLAAYYAFYEWGIRQNPSFDETKKNFSQRIATKVVGSELTQETWQPFIKTVKNSILKQTAADDIKHLTMPADIIFGSQDMFVIRGKVKSIFGTDIPNVTAHTIRVKHRINKPAAKFLCGRIAAVTTGEAAKAVHKYLPASR